MSERDWTAYSNEDGEPWAIFLHGHDYDLRTIRSLACKAEMKLAFERHCGDSDNHFRNNLNIGRWWIRDANEDSDDDASEEYPWHFCEKDDSGAIPITGARFT